jgi:hypothetical protein
VAESVAIDHHPIMIILDIASNPSHRDPVTVQLELELDRLALKDVPKKKKTSS